MLGRCCACGQAGGDVHNVICLDKLAPLPGHGWGCVLCDLPFNGAVAVLCDSCLAAERQLRWACRGYPNTEGRIRIDRLEGEYRHDMLKHATWEDVHGAPSWMALEG